MTEQGDLELFEAAEGTWHTPPPVTLSLNEVSDLAGGLSRVGGPTELWDTAAGLGRWQREHGVDSLSVLREIVEDEKRSTEQRCERLNIVERRE